MFNERILHHIFLAITVVQLISGEKTSINKDQAFFKLITSDNYYSYMQFIETANCLRLSIFFSTNYSLEIMLFALVRIIQFRGDCKFWAN